MILCTGKETGLPAYIWVKEIMKVETLSEKHKGKLVPYSRIMLENDKEHHSYFLDVLESREEISRKIKHERLDPGCEAKGENKNETDDD